MKKESKIYIAGHNGMVGSAILRKLKKEGHTNFVLRNSTELDLRNQIGVDAFFELERPEYVFLAAAKVGGIQANNNYRADFLYDNLMVQNNVIHSSYTYKVQKLLFLGSSCIYPKLAPQPLKEEYLLTGELEATNEPYAIAKIAGIKMCENYNRQYGCNFISAMPTNLYGLNDNFDLKSSHVLPAMIRKFHDAKLNSEPVELWGSGTPMREFLHVEDMAKAVVFAVDNKLPEHLYNVGTGTDVTIKELAETIQKVVGHTGIINWDSTKPDGTPRKLMDVSKMNQLGWKSKIDLQKGIEDTYSWFCENMENFKEVKMNLER